MFGDLDYDPTYAYQAGEHRRLLLVWLLVLPVCGAAGQLASTPFCLHACCSVNCRLLDVRCDCWQFSAGQPPLLLGMKLNSQISTH
jgi:hypothetical protein